MATLLVMKPERKIIGLKLSDIRKSEKLREGSYGISVVSLALDQREKSLEDKPW